MTPAHAVLYMLYLLAAGALVLSPAPCSALAAGDLDSQMSRTLPGEGAVGISAAGAQHVAASDLSAQASSGDDRTHGGTHDQGMKSGGGRALLQEGGCHGGWCFAQCPRCTGDFGNGSLCSRNGKLFRCRRDARERMKIGGIGVFISRRLTAFLPVRPRPTLSDPPMIAQPTPPYPLPDMPPLELAPPPSTIPSGKTKASEAVTGPAPSTMRGSPLAPELPAPSPAAAQAVPKAGLPEAAPAPSNSTSEPAPARAAATAPHSDTSEPVAEAEPAAEPQRRRFRPGAAFQIGPDCPPPPISPDPVEGCADFYEGVPFAITPEKDEDGYYDICSMYATDVCYDEEVDIYSSYHALDEAIPDSDEPSDLQGNSVPAPSPGQTAPMNGTSGGSGSKPSGEALLPVPQHIPETGVNGSPAQFVLEMGVEPGSAPQEGRVEEPDDTPTPQLSGLPTGGGRTRSRMNPRRGRSRRLQHVAPPQTLP